MARIRTIKPDFFTSEDIVGLTPEARLLYIALWCEADREGRLAGGCSRIDIRRGDVVGGRENDHRGDVRMRRETRERVEMQLRVRGDLAAAVARRDAHDAAHERRDAQRGGRRESRR